MARTIEVQHEIGIHADPDTIYGLVADVDHWPLYFPPTVHARRIDGDDADEVIELWALANGALRNWTSRRTLDPAQHLVRFQQQRSSAPVERMGGSWRIEPVGTDSCHVVLTHDYAVVDDDETALAAVARAVDTNSNAELAALKRAAERQCRDDETQFTFEDTQVIEGDLAQVYEFVRDCARWPDRVPHVRRLEVTETGELQLMSMDTAAPDGSVHTTVSARVCFPAERIVYKQTTPPEALAAHVGEWLFQPTGHGVAVTSRHSVVLSPEGLRALAERGVPVADPGAAVRRSLGANSLATMNSARQFLAAQLQLG